MSVTRYQIWGRCRDSRREVWIADLPSHEPVKRENELSDLAAEFGDHWELWIEGFPSVHPARQVHTPASAKDREMSLKEIKIKHTEREHIYALTPQ